MEQGLVAEGGDARAASSRTAAAAWRRAIVGSVPRPIATSDDAAPTAVAGQPDREAQLALDREGGDGHDGRAGGRRSLRALVARGPDGAEPASGDRIELGDRVRPVLLDGLAVLLQPPVDGVWTVQPRAVVEQYQDCFW